MFATFAVGSYEGKVAYCIEPGTPIDNAHTFTAKDETFWDNYPSSLNKTIDADTIKSLIGRILQYGYTGNIDPTWVSQNSAAADKLAHVYATQLLIWETIVGERDEQFAHVSTGGKNPVLDFIKQGHPLRSRIMDKYNSMVTSVQNHSKVPSFMAKSRGKAPTIELEWDGSQYTASLTDTNKVLGNYTFTSDYSTMKFSTSGNALTITSPTAPTGNVTVSASKKDSKRMGLVVWDDGTFGPGVGQQNTVTYTQSVTDPIAAYLKLNVSYGSAKIVKTSEDGKVEGIPFRITGNGIDNTVTTNSQGEVQIDNLQPGEYTVTEQVAGGYVPQEPQKVTVQAGQTATVSFNNSLQKGSLTVTKNSEDGLNSGVRFHLYGTSSMGETVDLYATTNGSGVAQFTDVPIGSGYTLEEVDTAIRYVVPAAQTANIEWEKATNASFRNVLKKFNITLNKVDGETGTQQGDATLAGAVYFGLYATEDITAADGSVFPADGLIETINCAEDGSAVFVTDLPLGSYYVKEISTDKHYTLPDTVYPVVFEYAGPDVALVEVALNDGEPITNELIYGSIKGLKIDRENQETIAGALFGLFRPDALQFTSETAILTSTSDEEGVFSFEDIPLGNWIVRELEPAEGYLPNTDIHHVQVERDDQVIEINVVNDRIPELGTTANIGGEKEVNATEIFTLEDVVEYTHLVPGKEYTVKGVLMDKATGEALKINGEQVKAETTFTPDNPSSTVTVAFEFDAKYIKADTDIVVFESLYQEGRELAIHADLEDESQTVTVHVPEIGTQATIGEEKEVTIDGPITIDDVVAFKNLTPGKEYSVYGILMDKNTGEALKVGGEEIHAESTFTPETADGETVVQFTFDTTGLVDSTEIVAFESLSREGIELAAHANIEDPAQTVKVTVTGPRIGTKAAVDGKKEVSGEGLITIEDVVSYKGLTSGKEYKLTGTLMNKTTGEPFKLNGEEIHAETTFTPESAEGEVVVSFPFDTSWVTETTDIVVFEKLSLNGKEIAVHEDIGDKEQTITIVVTRPEIGTKATIGGKKEAAPAKEITINDVVSYKNLTPGTEYKLVGVLMDKVTGNPFKVGDKEVRAEATFTPEKADGETVVKFTFDGSGITQAAEIVVFETLYQGEVKIAAHEDINDEGQTVKIVPVTPGKPTTPNPGNPQTGDRSIMGFWIGLGAIALGGLTAGIFMYTRKKKEQDGER